MRSQRRIKTEKPRDCRDDSGAFSEKWFKRSAEDGQVNAVAQGLFQERVGSFLASARERTNERQMAVKLIFGQRAGSNESCQSDEIRFSRPHHIADNHDSGQFKNTVPAYPCFRLSNLESLGQDGVSYC